MCLKSLAHLSFTQWNDTSESMSSYVIELKGCCTNFKSSSEKGIVNFEETPSNEKFKNQEWI
jgi:hypothetical protein